MSDSLELDSYCVAFGMKLENFNELRKASLSSTPHVNPLKQFFIVCDSNVF